VNFLAKVDQSATDKRLRYLVIGGLAINFYGYLRDTSDLDIFISESNQAEWMQLLAEFGYKNFHDGGSFIQYEAPEGSAWPVDTRPL
jgi:predicted nucleotidyltransferase